MPSLFDPIQLGAIHAKNRILMAPLTRGRATRAHVPTPIMADYYAQRAGAGLEGLKGECLIELKTVLDAAEACARAAPPNFSRASSYPQSRKAPSVNFMMFPLCTSVTDGFRWRMA